MGEITCARCGRHAAGLDRPPLPGEAGRAVQAGTCAECWRTWLAEQVKLINETRVSPAEPDGYAFLVERMRAFLGLGPAAGV